MTSMRNTKRSSMLALFARLAGACSGFVKQVVHDSLRFRAQTRPPTNGMHPTSASNNTGMNGKDRLLFAALVILDSKLRHFEERRIAPLCDAMRRVEQRWTLIANGLNLMRDKRTDAMDVAREWPDVTSKTIPGSYPFDQKPSESDAQEQDQYEGSNIALPSAVRNQQPGDSSTRVTGGFKELHASPTLGCTDCGSVPSKSAVMEDEIEIERRGRKLQMLKIELDELRKKEVPKSIDVALGANAWNRLRPAPCLKCVQSTSKCFLCTNC